MSFSKIRPNATGQRYGDSDLAPPQPRSGFGQPPPSSDPNAHLRHAVQGASAQQGAGGGSWMGPQHPIFQSQPPSASPPSGSAGDIAPPSPAVGGFFFPVPQQQGRGVPPNPGPSGALIPEARYDPRFPGDQGPAVAAPPPATWMPPPPPSFGTLGGGGAPLRLGDPDDDQLQPFAPQMMPHASRGGAYGMRGGAGRGSGPSSGNQFYY